MSTEPEPSEDLRFASLPELRAVQDAALRRQIALCASGSAFYRRLWAEHGVDPVAIRGVSDLHRLPLTDKKDFARDPEAFRLHCPELPLHERALWEVNYTTGTSGNPSPIYMTTHDWLANMVQARRIARIADIRDTDVFANLFPVTAAPMGSFSRSVAYAYAAGATIGAAMTGARFSPLQKRSTLDDAVRLVERHRATVLWGVTSFVRRVVIRAAELGADVSRVRMCAVTGEASTPAMREDIRARLRRLGADAVIFDRYGSTESGAFAQCCEDSDWHNPTPETLLTEVVDPDTGRPLPDGERGVLALTHLDRRGTVFLRYVVGDVVSLSHDACPHCGRIGDRIRGPVVRTKDLLKIRGMLVDPTALFDILRADDRVDEYQVVLRRQDPDDPFSMDELLLRVSTAAIDRDALSGAIAARVQQAVQVRPVVSFVPAASIYDPERESKAVRLIDERPVA
jgi:phenylacetate-coenzyme A ligase PaaK-like adenylate-forming protein